MLNLNDITFNKQLDNLIGWSFEMPYVFYCQPLGCIKRKKATVMDNNEANIKGDNNYVLQDNKNSDISIKNENNNSSSISRKNIIGLVSLVFTILAFIVSIIIGWDNIIKFFTQ